MTAQEKSQRLHKEAKKLVEESGIHEILTAYSKVHYTGEHKNPGAMPPLDTPFGSLDTTLGTWLPVPC